MNHPKWVLRERPKVDEEERIVGPLKCDELQLWNKENIPFVTSVCARNYAHYPKLFETYFKFAVIDPSGKRSLLGRIRLDGFTKENSKKFLKEFIENVSFKN